MASDIVCQEKYVHIVRLYILHSLGEMIYRCQVKLVDCICLSLLKLGGFHINCSLIIESELKSATTVVKEILHFPFNFAW